MPSCRPHGFLFLFGLVTAKLNIYNYRNENRSCRLFVGHKENPNICKLGEARQSLMRVLLSPLVSQGAASLCAEAGKYRLFSLARACIASEDKKRQLCKLHKVVSTYGPDGIQNSDA